MRATETRRIRDTARPKKERPDDTFLITVAGCAMRARGIDDGDLLVVDRTLKAALGDVVVAVIGGELTVGTLARGDEGPMLLTGGRDRQWPDFTPGENGDLVIWGVATGVYHALRPSGRPARGSRPGRGP